MGGLTVGIGMSDQGPRFTETEAESPKETLALAHADPNRELRLDESRKRFAVPEADRQPRCSWLLSQCPANRLHVGRCQPRRSSHSLTLSQTSKTRPLEPLDPVLDGPRRIPEQATDLRAGHSLSHEEDAVQAMVVSRVERTPNLVLEAEDDFRSVGNRKWLHAPIEPESKLIRNYLCRYV